MYTPQNSKNKWWRLNVFVWNFDCAGVEQVVCDVNHDVTQHQHFNVTISHPVPDNPYVGEEAPPHIHYALTISLAHHRTCCPTFDFLAFREVDVLEFGFVLHKGVQIA